MVELGVDPNPLLLQFLQPLSKGRIAVHHLTPWHDLARRIIDEPGCSPKWKQLLVWPDQDGDHDIPGGFGEFTVETRLDIRLTARCCPFKVLEQTQALRLLVEDFGSPILLHRRCVHHPHGCEFGPRKLLCGDLNLPQNFFRRRNHLLTGFPKYAVLRRDLEQLQFEQRNVARHTVRLGDLVNQIVEMILVENAEPPPDENRIVGTQPATERVSAGRRRDVLLPSVWREDVLTVGLEHIQNICPGNIHLVAQLVDLPLLPVVVCGLADLEFRSDDFFGLYRNLDNLSSLLFALTTILTIGLVATIYLLAHGNCAS